MVSDANVFQIVVDAVHIKLYKCFGHYHLDMYLNYSIIMHINLLTKSKCKMQKDEEPDYHFVFYENTREYPFNLKR